MTTGRTAAAGVPEPLENFTGKDETNQHSGNITTHTIKLS